LIENVENMKQIRTAILGYGRSGSTMHAGPIEKSDSFKMVAVCDIDPERRHRAYQRFGCTVYDGNETINETVEGNAYGDEYEIYREIAAAINTARSRLRQYQEAQS
jgi:predicted dehydrogenase